MFYYSTNNKSLKVDFREATIQGQAADKGLFFPGEIPIIPNSIIEEIEKLSKEEIAIEIMKPYVGDTIPVDELKRIIAETIDFDFPLVGVTENIYSLELFHGPSLAFKDLGARFMSRCLEYFVKNERKKITVLVATSGDTGGAVAHGFYNVEGVNVVILYPSGKVSAVQEVQLTSLGNNITAIEVDGSFDDCQRMVKNSFADPELKQKLFLTSANSINVARWLPQQLYYFFAYQQWKDKKIAPVISVPSGNFGNICAGLLAFQSGLPVSHFIAACNANDTIPQYLANGIFQKRDSIPTISNAMDVANPSNFIRILELFDHDLTSIKNNITGYSISDAETKSTIAGIFKKHSYLLDPHGAVGFAALHHYLNAHPGKKGIFLETAHPVKFFDVIEPIIGEKIEIPLSVSKLFQQKKNSIKMNVSDAELKSILLELDK